MSKLRPEGRLIGAPSRGVTLAGMLLPIESRFSSEPRTRVKRAAAFLRGRPGIEALKKTAPKVFIDCSSCDIEYIKTEITFSNDVRDRKGADVHILITTRSAGSGGRE